MQPIRRLWPQLTIVLISTLTTIIWFSSGQLIAVGEEGIWMYNPKITLGHYLHFWNEIGLGTSDPFFLPRVTHIAVLYVVNLFLTNWQAQALSFWFLITAGTLGFFFLLRRFLIVNVWILTLAAGFYFFNLYSLSQIWGRYISAGIFTWAFLPWFLWTWSSWLDSGRRRYLAAFILLNLVFANAFGSPVFIFTFWIPAGLYSLLRIYASPARIIIRSLLGGACWLVLNLTWLYPFAVTSGRRVEHSSSIHR